MRLKAPGRWWRFGFSAILVVAILGIAAVLAAGEYLARPVQLTVGPPPAALSARRVALTAEGGGAVAGWFARGESGGGVVLLLHGVRSDRRQMTARAIALRDQGFGVVLIDLPAHGESDGARISFGWHEARGVEAAARFIEAEFPGERVGVIGASLGAAALLFSHWERAPDAVVLEALYPTIGEAVDNRLKIRFGPLGSLLAPALLWQLPARLGIGADQLRPIDRIERWRMPALVVSGQEDRHTTAAETRRLHERANEPKELWLVPGAGHVDLARFAGPDYAERVYGFLHTHLRRPSTVDSAIGL